MVPGRAEEERQLAVPAMTELEIDGVDIMASKVVFSTSSIRKNISITVIIQTVLDFAPAPISLLSLFYFL